MLPQMPSVMNDLDQSVGSRGSGDPMPQVTQHIVAFSVHMRCDGRSSNRVVKASKRSVERGLRPPTTISEVQNVAADNVWLELGYGFDMMDDALEHKIDQDTILGAWVTEEGSPQVYKAHLTFAGRFRDGGTTQYTIELEHPRQPGRHVPFKQKQGDNVVTLTIVFRQ
jgi:hypothetical protein